MKKTFAMLTAMMMTAAIAVPMTAAAADYNIKPVDTTINPANFSTASAYLDALGAVTLTEDKLPESVPATGFEFAVFYDTSDSGDRYVRKAYYDEQGELDEYGWSASIDDIVFTDPLYVFTDTITLPKAEEPKYSGQTEIKYTVDASYYVTIPASVTLKNDEPVTKDIGFSEVTIGKGKQIAVTLEDAANKKTGSEFNVKLKDDDSTATYKVQNADGTTTYKLGDKVATFAYNGTEKTGSTQISFTAPEEVAFAGDYTDKLTFKVAVVDAPVTQTKTITGSHDGVNVSVTVTFTPGQKWSEATISDVTEIYEGLESKYTLSWNESKGMYTDRNNLWELKNGNSYVGKNDVIDENGSYSLVDTGWGMF